jgi:predicted DCC family thiol-disulfide oxidoreductase YuxK
MLRRFLLQQSLAGFQRQRPSLASWKEEDLAMTGILLRDILGAAFDDMPEAVRHMHSIEATKEASGTCRVVGGTNPLSRLVRALSALPRPARRAPILIRLVKGADGEEWDRRFGSSRFRTVMKPEGRYLAERLTALPVTMVYAVRAGRAGFALHVVEVRLLGLPLPRLLRPAVAARAGVWRGRYRFSIMAGFWFCGRVIGYTGYLDPPVPVTRPSVMIVYDGLCRLCGGSMAWAARRVDDRVRFVPAQSGEGAAALRDAGLDALDPESFLVLKDGQSLQKSRAVIAVLVEAGGGWKAAAVLLRLVPRRAADRIYGLVAANRYRWFGRRTTCFIPPP